MQKSDINYKQIYSDILDKKFPEKSLECYSILNKLPRGRAPKY